jgi:2-(1,2-epoxy-1,2-dihydrophenyl)acetyl-CoA isomerase
MDSYETLTVETDGAVATVTLNRPDNMNAFNSALTNEIVAAAKEVNADDSVRVVVLTGSGRAFSAGADLAEGEAMVSGQAVEDQLNNEYKPGLLEIANAPKPWIAAVNGACAGIGTSFALSCDLVVMGESAFFYQAFAAIGLVPDGGATWHLNRILGPKRAFELIASGEKVRGAKCLELGLCNRVVADEELLAEAQNWAGELAGKSPLALRYAKESLNFASENELGSVISNEARLQHICIDSEDAKEGVMAFMEKRTPNWQGR